VEQLAQHTSVSGEAVCGVKAAQAAPAERASALVIQGKGVLERCAATGTEKLGGQGTGLRQAASAHRIAKNLAQFFAADAAGIRKEEGKKGVRSGSYC
jgi:hypothetical protein